MNIKTISKINCKKYLNNSNKFIVFRFYKKLLFCQLILIVFSCTKDQPTALDPIVGKWNLRQFYKNGTMQNLDKCALLKTMDFRPDGSCTAPYFIKDTIANTCKPNGTSGYK